MELENQPWPLPDVVAKLCEAAHILLDQHDYDGDGWEAIKHAMEVGQKWVEGQKIKLEPLVEYGRLMTLHGFQKSVAHNFFTSDDGSGCYATDTQYDPKSNVWTHEVPSWATHVLWFNK